MINKIVILFMILCLAGTASSQVKEGKDYCQLTIEKMFNWAHWSIRMRTDSLRLVVEQEEAKESRALRYPEIAIGGTAGYRGEPSVFERGLTGATHPDSPNWTQNYGFSFSLPVYQGGRITQRIRIADAQVEKIRLQTIRNEEDLWVELMGYYANLLNCYARLEVRRERLRESFRRYEDVKNRFRAGNVTRNDVIRIQLQLMQDSLDYTSTHNDLDIVNHQLNVILGFPSSFKLLPDTALLRKTFESTPMENYLREANVRHPEMLMARQETKLAVLGVKLAKADLFPTVSFVAGNLLERPISRTLEDRFFYTWSIGLQVSIPISNFYKNRHRLRCEKVNIIYYQHEEIVKKQELDIQIVRDYIKHQESVDRIKTLKQAVRQAEENYRMVITAIGIT
ncbi:MAG: TolC family protein [Parabacteroides sp.]